jgi:hypothetical protein
MSAHAAVRVDDDLASGQTAVAVGAADHEAAGRVDPELGLVVEQLGRQHRPDHLFDDRFLELLVLDVGRVLGREHDRVDALGRAAVVAVLDRDLALRIRAQPRQLAVLAQGRLLPHQLVREHDRHRHQLFGLVDREAEHQTLVARALLLVQARAGRDALRDVGRLLLERGEHRARVGVEAHLRARVADLAHGLAHQLGHVERRGRGDLAGYDRVPGFHHRLARYARHLVLRERGVEDRIGDRVAHLVRVTLGHGF